ncbi:hypothetical protein L7F22_046095 [Adiantum nelumboides]|nr:hypothetical protein [Adiantum nelumboides]
MEERERVLDFLFYGGDAATLSDVAEASRAPFLPALAMLSWDSPSLASALFPSSHPLASSALAYASLDFSPICSEVLHLLRITKLHQEPPPDESFSFLSSDHKDRAKSMLISINRQAAEFRESFNSFSPRLVQQQQKDEGSMWGVKSCLSELICLLPVAVFRCPKVLSPDILIFGLLPARWGFILLTAVLLSNPLLAKKSLIFLSEFLGKYEDLSDCKKTSTETFFPNKYAKRDVLHQVGQQDSILVHAVKQAVLTFLHLGKSSRALACLCRDALVINCACASVALYLTTEYIGDEADFLSRFILPSVKTSEWMLKFFGGSEKDGIANLVGLFDCVDVMEQVFIETGANQNTCNDLSGSSLRTRKALLVDAHTTKEKFGWSGQLHGHLRLYCVLIWASESQPFPEELEFWLKSLIVAKGSLSVELLHLGVAFICLVSKLSGTIISKSLLQECVAALLKCSVPREARYVTDVEEQAIWFAVQLQLRRFLEIAKVLREAIGAQVTVQSSDIEELHDAAMDAGIISEPSMLFWAVARLRPKGPLSSETTRGHYILECLYQLLRSGNFSRNAINVSEAIAHIISVSRTPIDGQGRCSPPITCFAGRESCAVREQYMEQRWLDFMDILPQWFTLAASLFPERMEISDLLASFKKKFIMPTMLDNAWANEHMEGHIVSSKYPESGISLWQSEVMNVQGPETQVILTLDSVKKAVEGVFLNPKPAIQVLSALNRMSAEKGNFRELFDYQVFIIKELVPNLLDSKCSQCLQERFCTWFKSLQPLSRHTLLPALMEVILDTSSQQECDSKDGLLMVQLKTMVSQLSVTTIGSCNSLLQQPLVLLACKPKVYQSPLLSTVLDLLQEFRTINRRTRLEIVSEGTRREWTIRSDEVIMALLAQDSALCQILLEVCLQHGDNIEPRPLLQARETICGFLASLLETNHELLKLVHMQGYNPELVSMMVKGVPAMVQCLSFANDLLQQQEPSKQAFAIILIADLACSYLELPESLVAVQKAVAHVSFLQRSSLASSSFMQQILEALVQCAWTFPAITADVRHIMQRCLKLSRPRKQGHMPRDPMLHKVIRSALRRICQKIG